MEQPNSPIVDPEAVRRTVADLLGGCRRSVLLLVHGECAALDPVLARRMTPEALPRDIDWRCVIPSRVLTTPTATEWLVRLEDLGASIRFSRSVPQTIMVIDRRTALVAPLRPVRSRRPELSILGGKDPLVAIGAFCEFVWDSAEPAEPEAGHRIGLSRQELGVLRLLAEGHTDQVVARRMGVSVRTAGRLTAALMGRLDARSRFQAGARAAQLGLLPLRGGPDGWCSHARHRSGQLA